MKMRCGGACKRALECTQCGGHGWIARHVPVAYSRKNAGVLDKSCCYSLVVLAVWPSGRVVVDKKGLRPWQSSSPTP